MVIVSPQFLGLWDPLQMAMKMAYKWALGVESYPIAITGMILQVGFKTFLSPGDEQNLHPMNGETHLNYITIFQG